MMDLMKRLSLAAHDEWDISAESRELARDAHAEIERLRAIEAAADAHVAECHALAAADGAYASKHPSLAARSAAMAALLIARRGVVASSAWLVRAVAK